MRVAEGQGAGIAWELLVRGGLDQAERETTRKALLDYCGQDTLAMVRIVEKLHRFGHECLFQYGASVEFGMIPSE